MNIIDKINTARELLRTWSDALHAEPSISDRLKELKNKADASSRMAVHSGVADACRRCDQEEGGSCCGAGIENRYTPELLLINLMLGADLPDSKLMKGSCFFLGTRGCTLPARDILCINYLCTRLQKEIPSEELHHLQSITGEEMDFLFRLHNDIRNFIKRKTDEI